MASAAVRCGGLVDNARGGDRSSPTVGGMARSEIDHEGVASARHALAADPDALRECAARVSAALVSARWALGDTGSLSAAVERYRILQARGLEAMAEAAAVLGGDLDVVVESSRATELAVAGALGAVSDQFRAA